MAVSYTDLHSETDRWWLFSERAWALWQSLFVSVSSSYKCLMSWLYKFVLTTSIFEEQIMSSFRFHWLPWQLFVFYSPIWSCFKMTTLMFSAVLTSYFVSSSKAHYYVLSAVYFLNVTFAMFQSDRKIWQFKTHRKKNPTDYFKNAISILTQSTKKNKMCYLLWLISSLL